MTGAGQGSSIARAVALLAVSRERMDEARAHVATAYEALVDARACYRGAFEESAAGLPGRCRGEMALAHTRIREVVTCLGVASAGLEAYSRIIAPSTACPSTDSDLLPSGAALSETDANSSRLSRLLRGTARQGTDVVDAAERLAEGWGPDTDWISRQVDPEHPGISSTSSSASVPSASASPSHVAPPDLAAADAVKGILVAALVGATAAQRLARRIRRNQKADE